MQRRRHRLLSSNIFQLDVLRGVAVILVMCFHFFKNFSFGWVGVDLFFVLSGFLITGKLVESIGSHKYLPVFYLNRILRIVPLYYLVLIFFFLILPAIAPSHISESMRQLISDQGYYWTFIVNFIEAKEGWPANITLIHFWSLACEMQFYLLWPFLILWIKWDKNKKLVLWVFIFLAIVFRMFIADYYSLHLVSKYVLLFSRIDAFAIGGLAYYYIVHSSGRNKKIPPLMLSLVALTVILALSINYNLNWHYANEPVQWIGYTLNAFWWGGILIFYFLLKFKHSLVERFLAVMGKYSYAMYVFHLPVWIFLEEIRPGNQWLIAAAFIITFLLAYLSYHLFEKHFLRLKPVPKHA